MNLVKVTKFIRENKEEICKGCNLERETRLCYLSDGDAVEIQKALVSERSINFEKYHAIFTEKRCPYNNRNGGK